MATSSQQMEMQRELLSAANCCGCGCCVLVDCLLAVVVVGLWLLQSWIVVFVVVGLWLLQSLDCGCRSC